MADFWDDAEKDALLAGLTQSIEYRPLGATSGASTVTAIFNNNIITIDHDGETRVVNGSLLIPQDEVASWTPTKDVVSYGGKTYVVEHIEYQTDGFAEALLIEI